MFRHSIKREDRKIKKLLGNVPDKVPKFITKKWTEVHYQPGSTENRYKSSKQIRYKKSMLRSDLCDYRHVYIVFKGTITVTDPNNAAFDQKVAFKHNVPFIICILKINNTLIDNVKDLDIVMSLYNLLEYGKNYSKTSGSLWNCYKDEPNSGTERKINYPIKDSKSFDFRTSITGKLKNNYITRDLTSSPNCVTTSKA